MVIWEEERASSLSRMKEVLFLSATFRRRRRSRVRVVWDLDECIVWNILIMGGREGEESAVLSQIWPFLL
jgi:hypothetical protein